MTIAVEEIIRLYNENESRATEDNPELYRMMRWKHRSEEESLNIKKQIGSSEDVFYHLNRFSDDGDKLINEIGGLTDGNIRELKEIYHKLKTLSDKPFPIDSILSAWAARQKIIAAKPDVKYILEIGPGAGLTSFLFSNIKTLVNYTQIEATQSMYLSQMAINVTAFYDIYEAALHNTEPFTPMGLWHIPWWKIKWLYNAPIKYDVILACACLNEMSAAAFDFYLPLFTNKAADDCVFIIQGAGNEYPLNQNITLGKLREYGWNVIHSESDHERGGISGITMVNFWLNRTKKDIARPSRPPFVKKYVHRPQIKEELLRKITE